MMYIFSITLLVVGLMLFMHASLAEVLKHLQKPHDKNSLARSESKLLPCYVWFNKAAYATALPPTFGRAQSRMQ